MEQMMHRSENKIISDIRNLIEQSRHQVAAAVNAGGEESCGCDHVNYCIARMYSREMACYQNVDDVPPCLKREIEAIKKRAAARK